MKLKILKIELFFFVSFFPDMGVKLLGLIGVVTYPINVANYQSKYKSFTSKPIYYDRRKLAIILGSVD